MPRASFKHRVLLVDDDPHLRKLLQEALESDDFEICTAEDGFEALAVLRGALPEVIVCDRQMPNMSGVELLSILRRRFPHIGVVAMSGDLQSSSRHPQVIADAFLAKPFKLVELVQTIRELIARFPIRTQGAKIESVPFWIAPQKGYCVITCTECLRSFLSIVGEATEEAEQRTLCTHCSAELHYVVDRSPIKLKAKSKSTSIS